MDITLSSCYHAISCQFALSTLYRSDVLATAGIDEVLELAHDVKHVREELPSILVCWSHFSHHVIPEIGEALQLLPLALEEINGWTSGLTPRGLDLSSVLSPTSSSGAVHLRVR